MGNLQSPKSTDSILVSEVAPTADLADSVVCADGES
jgi:hypothetical protein